MLGNRRCEHCPSQPQVGRMIGRDGNNRCLGRTFALHMSGNEIGDLARTLADQTDHDRVGLRTIDNHIHQH